VSGPDLLSHLEDVRVRIKEARDAIAEKVDGMPYTQAKIDAEQVVSRLEYQVQALEDILLMIQRRSIAETLSGVLGDR
jgi:hypothetical protein